MDTILTQKNNHSVFLVFLYSIVLHFLFVLSFVFFPHFPIKKEEKQNIVYMQITAAPPQTAAIPKPKPKEQPKKPVVKKLVQQQPINSKPAPVVQQPPAPQNTAPQQNNTVSSTNADATDVATKPVVEAVVDKAARCPTPDIALTQDAANAGITSGKVVLEVQISPEGKVTEAKVTKGTGYQIDDAVVTLAKKMNCTPAEKDGKSVAVIKRLQWVIQR